MAQIVSILDNAETALGKSDELIQCSITCLTQYYAWRADPTAEAALNRIVNALHASATEATKMIHPLRDALKYVEAANPERACGTRERSARLFNAIVSGSVPAMRDLIARKLRREELTDKEEITFNELEHLLVVCAGFTGRNWLTKARA